MFPLKYTSVVLCFPAFMVTAHSNEKEVPARPSAPTGIRRMVTGPAPRATELPASPQFQLQGTIAHYKNSIGQLTLFHAQGRETIQFTCGTATTFRDLAGQTLDRALLIPETPVVVLFTTRHQQLVADRVVAQRTQVPLPGGGMKWAVEERFIRSAPVVGNPVPKPADSPAAASAQPGGLHVKQSP